MYKKLMFIILIGLCLSFLANNVYSVPFEKMKAIQLPKDQFQPPSVPPFPAGDFCSIQNDDGTPVYITADFDSGVGIAVLMDPEKCGVPIPYPFKITDVHFYLYGAFSDSVVWPVQIQIKIRELSESDECNGPGELLLSETVVIPADSDYYYLGREMNLSLSQSVCTSQPFFLEIEYETETDPEVYPLPSIFLDEAVAEAESCNNWGTEYGAIIRWVDFWEPPDIPGDAMIRATGYANASECWYWKPDRPNQEFPAPSGMPDFGQYQFDDSMALCGPTAIANCLWWFDAVPKGMNPPEFIRLLSDYFHTNPNSGTYVDSIKDGLDRYFNDYGFSLYADTFPMPEFLAMEDSLKRSQDIILLLGFWQEAAQDQWGRFGGHFVTMAGVCSDSLKIAFSDPARDAAEYGWPGRVRPEHDSHPEGDTVHNDPEYISHDIYQALLESPSPGGLWSLPDYYLIDKMAQFEGQNFQPGQEYVPYIPGEPVFAEIEYAIMICPSNWYWKPDTLPQAPSGMPDFDQNQDDWVSYCGPTAVANCLWWFDAVPDGWTPPQLIDTLAIRMKCRPEWGTYVDTMQMALEQYFQDYGFALQEYTFWRPNFDEMEDSLKRCQDIILLLGFWEEVEQDSFIRVGGHYVTMAGVCSESLKIAFSDPYYDNAESGGPGRVRPPHAPHPTDDTLHNNPAYVSQDIYTSTTTSPSPGNPNWGLLGYPPGKSSIQDFVGKNFHPEQLQYYHTDHEVKGPIYTEVEWAVMICPKPTAVEDEGEGSAITPKDFELYQSYPNPFNSQTIIKYDLRKSCQVTLTVYNILGQKVKTLAEGYQEAGSKIENWNGKDEKGKNVASGIYFYQLKAGDVTQTKRMILLK